MSVSETIDLSHVFIYAKKMKKLYSVFSTQIRKNYDLKQIDLEIIFYLDRHRDASLGEISRKMYLNKGQLSQAISALRSKGYIRTEKDENDQRYTYYRLTDRSEALLCEIKKLTEYSGKVLLEGVSEKQKEIYCAALKQIGANIDKLEKECK
ncbi:MAG: MarR family winged helix-turn-helix transcriptional regulator [Lachnospiraceae bacterium]|nr:MarR family winged helix-turn-helix transcriptional regulator [Lachnospiraceae bacterium]